MGKGKILLVILVVVLIASVIALAIPAYAAEKPKERQITIYSASGGVGMHVLLFALADVINKNSSWLRATPVETPSAGTAMLRLAQDPEARKNAIAAWSSVNDLDAVAGTGPYKGYPWTAALIAKTFQGPWTWLTPDSNIKTPKDLIGKRIAIGASPATAQAVISNLMFDLWGIKDKVKPVFIGFEEGTSALLSREVSVMALGVIAIKLGQEYQKSIPLERLKASMKIYWVNFDLNQTKDYLKKAGLPLFAHKIPAGTGITDVDVTSVAASTAFAADPNLDDDVVYEVTRLIYENSEKFAGYHAVGKAMTRETMAELPGGEKRFHKAALKFFKEKGIKIGIPDF